MAEQEQSSAVTALSVISMVFGIIGMLGAFIPCLGVFALFVAIPAAICGGAAFFIASSKKTSKSFAIAALTISLIGVVIAGLQYMALASTGAAINEAAKSTGAAINEAAKESMRQQQLQQRSNP